MHANVAELLADAAAQEPDKAALRESESGRSITWRALDSLVDRVAAGLDAQGMVAGYRLMLVLGNSVEFVAGYLGALRLGLVVVPANPRGTAQELRRMLEDSGARMVLADERTIGTVREVVAALAQSDRPPVRVVLCGGQPQGEERDFDTLVAATSRAETAGPRAPLREDPEALAVLLYTSGTSGQPRGAMLSHRALLANIEQIGRVHPPMLTGRDVVLGVLPLFHSYGLNAVLGQVLRCHARLVLVDEFDPEDTLDLIEDEAISVLPVAPAVLAYWMEVTGLDDRLLPVRTVLSGSAPLSPALHEAFLEHTGLPVYQGYGLTEAAPVVTSTLLSEDPQPTSVGPALPGIELRLVDDGDRPPEPGDSGEIQIRGDNLFSGYWPDGADGPANDGWWATGDVGFLDQQGDLYLVDRVKELVIVSGFNVYPIEVEDVLVELPEVEEAAVIGAEDPRTGEAVVAYVRPARPGVAPAEVADAVRRHCEQRLARFKQPTTIHVVEHFPHTVTGKIRKGQLRATERRRSLGLLE